MTISPASLKPLYIVAFSLATTILLSACEPGQAEADLNKTRQQYDRNVMLHKEGLVSPIACEDLEYDVAALQAARAIKWLEPGYTMIRAPISGVISARHAKIGNHSAKVTATINNLARKLAPGMFGHFAIAYEKHGCATTIPASAIVQEDNSTIVYVVEDGFASRRAVKTGIMSGERVEILDGLSPEDSVIVTGSAGLRDGTRVLAGIKPEFPGGQAGI